MHSIRSTQYSDTSTTTRVNDSHTMHCSLRTNACMCEVNTLEETTATANTNTKGTASTHACIDIVRKYRLIKQLGLLN